jgi:hypothetical protein
VGDSIVMLFYSLTHNSSASRRYSSAVNRTLSAVFRILSAVFRILSAVNRIFSAVYRILSAVNRILSAANRILSAVNRILLSLYRIFAVQVMMTSKTDMSKSKLWKMVDAARDVSDILKGRENGRYVTSRIDHLCDIVARLI